MIRQGILVPAPAGSSPPTLMRTSTAVFDLQDPLPQPGHRGVDEHCFGLGIGDDVGDLVLGEVRVDGAVVQAGKLAAPGDFEELRTVRQLQRNTVATPQARTMQRSGDALTSGVQLTVGDCAALGEDRGR